jgi:hypothetical protein
MTKDWYSAAELAGLPEMPGTERRVRTRATRENWTSRPRSARGGGREYHLTSLPDATQAHLRRQRAVATVNGHAAAALDVETFLAGEQLQRSEAERARREQRERGWAEFAALQEGPRKARARAREWLLVICWAFLREHPGTRHAGLIEFAHLVVSGEITMPDSVRDQLPVYNGRISLERSTLQRWEQRYRARGVMGLVDGRGQVPGQSKIETTPELRAVVLGCLTGDPHITPRKIKAYLAAARPDLDIVSTKGIERFMRRWKEEHAQVWTYATHPDRWKSAYMAAQGSHFERIERLNQVWEMDSTPGDWLLTDGRHVVIGVIDLYSRRLKLLVSRSSKAMAVGALFRRALLDWGVPEIVRTDNGKDYVSQQFDGVLRGLEVVHELCLPFASEEKGTVERALQTMSHGVLDLLPGFIGHSVAERKVIEARKSFAQRVMTPGETVEVALSADELQARLNDWTDHVYAHDGHAGLDGQTPFAVAAAWTQPIRRIGDERALDLLLAELAGVRTVTKKGLRVDNHWYIHPHLHEHAGDQVRLKRDEADLGRLYVYKDDAFVCIAECPELTGISRREWAVIAKKHQRRFVAAQAVELRQYKKQLGQNIAETVMQHRIAQSTKLAALPKRHETHTSPGLDAARHAASARDDQIAPRPLDAREQELLAQVARNPRPAPVTPLHDDARQRFARAIRLERRLADGEDLPTTEAHWLGSYRQTAEYRAEKRIHEDFGLQVEPLAAE